MKNFQITQRPLASYSEAELKELINRANSGYRVDYGICVIQQRIDALQATFIPATCKVSTV
jgi:hypothetical protein